MSKIVLTLTEDNCIIYGEAKTYCDSDIEITQAEIEDLVETEMDDSCHDDYIEDYDNKLEYYLSNAEEDSYTEYIKQKLDDKNINDTLAYEIQKLVVEEIKNKTNID